MDGLKELVEAFSARIKSPIIGSIALAFIAINWRAVFFLFFSGEPASDKFAYFTENTTGLSLYLYPVIVGLAFALLVPWVNFLGAKAIESPVTNHRNMQLDAAHTLAERKTRHAIDMETVSAEHRKALLESAKVDQEIKEADIDEDVRADLEDKLVESKGAEPVKTADLGNTQKPLSDAAETLFMRAAKDASGRISFGDDDGVYYMKYGPFDYNMYGNTYKPENTISQKASVLAQEAIRELVKNDFMKEVTHRVFDVTAKGYSYLDGLEQSKQKEQ